MPEVELEPDRNRMHDLVRLVWQSADQSSGGRVTDQDVADAGPYSVEQVREHLTSEQEGTYVLEQDGDTVVVLSVEDA
jgi:hypothetical protein